MILRVLSIIVALAATGALWFVYAELSIFRRTVFWEYRYIIFGSGAFLVLSLLEYALGHIRAKTDGDTSSH